MPPLIAPTSFTWRSETEAPAPITLEVVDDALTADEALRRVRRGEVLLYAGDFNNAKQLLAAMSRRLPASPPTGSPLSAFRAQRRVRQVEHETLGRLVVALDADYRLQLRRAPDVALACTQVWGQATGPTVVPLKTLLGLVGAAEWRRKGLEVPGLKGRLTPHYGVYLPTRTDYVELLAALGDVRGRRVFEVGTGTGVLSFILLQRGAESVVATDLEPRAVACARQNAESLGLASRFQVQERDLFPEGRADLVLFNPPWLPEAPRTRMDRAVFDDGGAALSRFLEGLSDHLTPGGFGVLLLSDLAELLGLRSKDWLMAQLERCGIEAQTLKSVRAQHGKAKDRSDPLHEARSQEVTTLYRLRPR